MILWRNAHTITRAKRSDRARSRRGTNCALYEGENFFYRIGAVRRASVDESQTDDCVQGRTGLDSGGRQMEYGAGDSYCVQQNKIIHVR